VYHLETSPDRLRPLWGVLRASLLAAKRYTPRPYPGRVVLFRADSRRLEALADPTLGWDALAIGGVTVHVVPGDHYTMLRSPGVGVLAGLIESEVGRPGAE
jgi:thioesterase domain-containing protein